MKKIVILSLILLTTISMVINVYATSTFEMSLQPSKKELDKGEEFTVDVKISNIQMDKGIVAIGGKIEYDRDSLELVKLDAQDKWARPSYNENNGKFATDRDDYGTGDEVIFKITFKVKEQSKENLTITVSEIAGSNGKDEVKLNNIKTDISLKKVDPKPDDPKPDDPKPDDPKPNTNTNTDNNNTTTNNNTTNTTNKNNTVNNDKNNTTNNNNTANNVSISPINKNNPNSGGNIVANTQTDGIKGGIFPKTGAGRFAFGLIALLIISAIVFYIRIRIINSKAIKNNIIK